MSEDYKIQQAMSAGKASSLQRYMKLVLGQESIGRLLLYEFVLLISSRRSGALGLFLRKKMYPWILGSETIAGTVRFAQELVASGNL